MYACIFDPSRSELSRSTLGSAALRWGVIGCLVLGVAACGSLGGEGGGDSNLPTRGVAPYAFWTEAGEELPDPTAEGLRPLLSASEGAGRVSAVSDGAAMWLYREEGTGSTWRLLRHRLLDGWNVGEVEEIIGLPSPPEASAWQPGVLRDTLGRWWLVTAGERLTWYRSTDGRQWTQDGSLPQIEGLTWRSPSPVVRGDERLVFAVIATGEDAGRVMGWREGASAWTEIGVVFGGGEGCLNTSGQPAPCWDRAGVDTLEVRPALTAVGRPLLRMWYSAANSGDVGFAASWDGMTWSRFRYNPTLRSGRHTLRWPTNAALRGGLYLYVERSARREETRVIGGRFLGTGATDEL